MCNSNLVNLKNNPIFHLSLSSKELFHSNFLCWLAEDENCTDIFRAVLRLFGYEDEDAKNICAGLHEGKYMALREYKNLDFCICEKLKSLDENCDDNIVGRILFVLENKFKSIPYEAQLVEYSNKVHSLNKEGEKNLAKIFYLKSNGWKQPKRWNPKLYQEFLPNHELSTKFVLLSLAKDACGLDTNKDSVKINDTNWNFISYQNYANCLYREVKEGENLTNDLIRQYAQFIDSFCCLLKDSDTPLPNMDDIDSKQWNVLSCRKDMKEIRMDDIWQKLVANIIGKRIIESLKDNDYSVRINRSVDELFADYQSGNDPNNDINLGVGFARGTAIIDIKLVLNKNILFGIQIQGNAYKHLLEVNKQKGDINSELTNFKTMFRFGDFVDWESTKDSDIFEYTKDEGDINHSPIHPNISHVKNGQNGFGGYGDTFICQWKNICDKTPVSNVVQTIINDINTAVKIKHEFYVDGSL